MKLDTSDYYPWGSARKRPAELQGEPEVTNSVGSAMSGEATEQYSQDKEEKKSEPPYSDDKENRSLGITESEIAETPEAPRGVLTAISHVLSWILSPVLTPTLGIVAVFELSMLSYAPLASKLLIIGIVFSLTCIIPCAAIWVLTRFGDVTDIALTRRTDRLYPYIITAGCLAACGFYLIRTGLPAWIGYFYIGAAAATIINLLINFKWKISAHGAGIGGLIAMLMILNRYGLPSYNLWGWITAGFFLAGLLGAARVWLWRHTPMQTICGEIVGFLGVMATEFFLNS